MSNNQTHNENFSQRVEGAILAIVCLKYPLRKLRELSLERRKIIAHKCLDLTIKPRERVADQTSDEPSKSRSQIGNNDIKDVDNVNLKSGYTNQKVEGHGSQKQLIPAITVSEPSGKLNTSELNTFHKLEQEFEAPLVKLEEMSDVESCVVNQMHPDTSDEQPNFQSSAFYKISQNNSNMFWNQELPEDEDIASYCLMEGIDGLLIEQKDCMELQYEGYSWCRHTYKQLSIAATMGVTNTEVVYFGLDVITSLTVAVVIKLPTQERASSLIALFRNNIKKASVGGSEMFTSPKRAPKKPPRNLVHSCSFLQSNESVKGVAKTSKNVQRSKSLAITERQEPQKSSSDKAKLGVTPEEDTQSRFFIPSALSNERRGRSASHTYDFRLKNPFTDYNTSLANENESKDTEEVSETDSQSDMASVMTESNRSFIAGVHERFQGTLQKMTPTRNRKSSTNVQKVKFFEDERDYYESLVTVSKLRDKLNDENFQVILDQIVIMNNFHSQLLKQLNSKSKFEKVLNVFIGYKNGFRHYIDFSRHLNKLKQSPCENTSEYILAKLEQIDSRINYYVKSFEMFTNMSMSEGEQNKLEILIDVFQNILRKTEFIRIVDTIQGSPIKLEHHIPILYQEKFYVTGTGFTENCHYNLILFDNLVLVIANSNQDDEGLHFVDALRLDQTNMASHGTNALMLNVNYGTRRGEETIILTEVVEGKAKEAELKIKEELWKHNSKW